MVPLNPVEESPAISEKLIMVAEQSSTKAFRRTSSSVYRGWN